MNKVFGTFNGFINHDKVQRKIIFDDLTNELGEKISGKLLIADQMVIACMRLKFGDRYLINYQEIEDGVMINVTQTKKVNKNTKCKVFRRFKDEMHFIGGKHQGKKDSDLDEPVLSDYCVWLARNSYNEATIKNCLHILKKLHNENLDNI